MVNWITWVTLAIVIVLYGAIYYLIRKRKLFSNHGVTTYGPLIMWKTERGREFIDWLARPKRFWRAYAFLAKAVCLLVAVFMLVLLLWEATIVSRIPDSSAPTPEMMLGIPGLNPIIPIIYGIIGLIVAIIVHEFAHGILTRVGGLSLKSLGIILLIIPLGAFVEPDEQQITATDRKRRTSIFAVGSATNIFLALFCAILFCSGFMSSAQPVNENPVITSVGENSPAYHGGLAYGMQVMQVEDISIMNLDDWNDLNFDPGTNVTFTYFYEGASESSMATSGLAFVKVSPDLAAAKAGIEPGMIVASLNDTMIRNQSDFESALSFTQPHQTVNITVLAYYSVTNSYQVAPITKITLDSRKEYYLKVDPGQVNDSFVDRGFMGVNTAYMGAILGDPNALIMSLAHPLAGANSLQGVVGEILQFIALPLRGLAPVESPLSDLFVPTGWLAWMPQGMFWFLANTFYWIFWINLMVGMTNVLPAVPLDGGYLFRDSLDWLIEHFKKGATESEKARIQRQVSTITIFVTVLVFFLIFWQLIGPRLL